MQFKRFTIFGNYLSKHGIGRGLLRLSIALILLFTTSCVDNLNYEQKKSESTPNLTDGLAKDWREQVRKSSNNPYERYDIPSDNDSEYYKPKQNQRSSSNSRLDNGKLNNVKPGGKVYSNSMPVYEDYDDAFYGKFPRYNPDDDNVYIDPKKYPLYLDY